MNLSQLILGANSLIQSAIPDVLVKSTNLNGEAGDGAADGDGDGRLSNACTNAVVGASGEDALAARAAAAPAPVVGKQGSNAEQVESGFRLSTALSDSCVHVHLNLRLRLRLRHLHHQQQHHHTPCPYTT